MDHDIIVLLDHSDRTFTLKLKTSSSYDDFKTKLDDNGLNPNRVTKLTFSIPEHSVCWPLMNIGQYVNAMKVYNLRVVNMKVIFTTEVQQDGIPNSSTSSMNNGLNGEKDAQSNSTPLVGDATIKSCCVLAGGIS